MKKKPYLPLLSLLLAFVLMLTGCWQEVPEDSPDDLVIDPSVPEVDDANEPAVSTLPTNLSLAYDSGTTLDPLTCPDGANLTLAGLLYEGLFQLDEMFQPQQNLCAGYEYNETKTIWTFQVRDDVLFSDGTRLTSADVAAALNRARDTDRYRARLAAVTGVTHSGDTVTVTLSSPNASLPSLLDIPVVKKGTENDPVPAGTGPYHFSASEECPQLVPSETWRGTASLPAERILLSECSGTTGLYHQFSSREIHLITTDLTGQDAFRPSGAISIWDADTTVLQFIGFNAASPLFSSSDLRNALSRGIDRVTLVNTYLAGHAAPAQSPVSPVSPMYPHVLDSSYSLTSFRDAMAAAGFDAGTPRKATLLVNNENSFKVSAAQYIAEALSVCDIQVTVKALPWEEYTAALAAGDFDLYYGEVKLTADWDLTQLVGTGGSLNFGGYSSVVMDILLAGYASAEDPKSALQDLCRYLQAQAPILPLCFKYVSVLTERGVVEGLSPTAATPFHDLDSILIHLAKS